MGDNCCFLELAGGYRAARRGCRLIVIPRFSGSAGGKSTEEVLQTVMTLKTNVIGLGNYINSVNRCNCTCTL